MHYTPITSTLGFILSKDKKSLLMVHRTFRNHDDQLGKYNVLGGKLEANEDIAAGMIREIKEEAGIKVTSMKLRGTVNWTNFGPKLQNWLAFIFIIDDFEGEPFSKNEEGNLQWVNISDLDSLPMWEGDKLFFPLVLDNNEKIFHGYMPYDNDKVLDWKYTRI